MPQVLPFGAQAPRRSSTETAQATRPAGLAVAQMLLLRWNDNAGHAMSAASLFDAACRNRRLGKGRRVSPGADGVNLGRRRSH
jgi:hypothetical protein